MTAKLQVGDRVKLTPKLAKDNPEWLALVGTLVEQHPEHADVFFVEWDSRPGVKVPHPTVTFERVI